MSTIGVLGGQGRASGRRQRRTNRAGPSRPTARCHRIRWPLLATAHRARRSCSCDLGLGGSLHQRRQRVGCGATLV